MAYPEVSEETIYLTAGAAVPAVIKSMLAVLLNDGFEVAYNYIRKVVCKHLIFHTYAYSRS
jgi:hypothetical protein